MRLEEGKRIKNLRFNIDIFKYFSILNFNVNVFNKIKFIQFFTIIVPLKVNNFFQFIVIIRM